VLYENVKLNLNSLFVICLYYFLYKKIKKIMNYNRNNKSQNNYKISDFKVVL